MWLMLKLTYRTRGNKMSQSVLPNGVDLCVLAVHYIDSNMGGQNNFSPFNSNAMLCAHRSLYLGRMDYIFYSSMFGGCARSSFAELSFSHLFCSDSVCSIC